MGRLGQADVDTAQCADHVLETGEVDLDIVVDVDAGQHLHGAHEKWRPAEGERRVEFVEVRWLRNALGVDVRGNRHPGVARQRDERGLLIALRQVRQNHRVGALSLDLGLALLGLRELVAGACPAVRAHEQHVLCAGFRGCAAAGDDARNPRDVVVVVQVAAVQQAAARQHEYRQDQRSRPERASPAASRQPLPAGQLGYAAWPPWVELRRQGCRFGHGGWSPRGRRPDSRRVRG